MADKEPNNAARDRLQAVLAAYGADPARWPEADRELAALMGSGDSAVSAPLDEARTLDWALSRASKPVVPAGAAERLIVRADDGPAVVVPFAQPTPPRPHGRAALPGRLAAMVALAASLALGIYLGASGQFDWLTSPMLAEEPPEYVTAELDVLGGTVQLFEEHTEP